MTITVSSKGEIVLPPALREQDGIEPGQRFEIERIEDGHYALRKQASPAAGAGGVVDWLLACPEKDWFQPLPTGESTEAL